MSLAVLLLACSGAGPPAPPPVAQRLEALSALAEAAHAACPTLVRGPDGCMVHTPTGITVREHLGVALPGSPLLADDGVDAIAAECRWPAEDFIARFPEAAAGAPSGGLATCSFRPHPAGAVIPGGNTVEGWSERRDGAGSTVSVYSGFIDEPGGGYTIRLSRGQRPSLALSVHVQQ